MGAGGADVARDELALLRGGGGVALAQPAAARVDAHVAARLGIDEDDLADVGQGLLGGVADLAHDDVVAHRQLAQAAGPVARAAQVADDDDRARDRARAWRVRESASPRLSGDVGHLVVVGPVCHLAHLQEHADEADPALARRHEERIGVAVGEQAEAVAAPAGDVADGEHDALGDIGLAAQRRAEAHRLRGVEHEPGGERALGDVQPHVRLVHARGRVPVDQAHVVARLVRPHLRELHRDAQGGSAVVAREQALDAAANRQIERAQRGLGHGAWTWPRRARRRNNKCEVAHATSLTSSTRGIGTRLEHRPDDCLGADALGERAVREHEAVTHRVGRELVHVGGQHVAAAAQDGERACGVQHADRAAGADAERDERVEALEAVAGEVARDGGEAHGVARDGGIDVDALHRGLQREQLRAARSRGARRPAAASARCATVCSSSIAG